MCEGVITYLVTLIYEPPQQIRVRLAIFTDNEKRGGDAFALQHIENRRCPLRIWTIIKRQGDHAGVIAFALNHIRRRNRNEVFPLDVTSGLIDVEIAPAILGT